MVSSKACPRQHSSDCAALGPAHGNATTLPSLSNVELVFLPPNTTSKLQPWDAGIIASMKVHYRRFQMERALDLAEEESVLDIYKVEILSAMLALKRV
eukprot:IDg21816t1